ncbi:MAG: transposase, partial [Proteocatella sp.]
MQSVYAMVLLDTIHYNVWDGGIVTKKTAYIAIGADLDARKDVLGICLGAN